MVVTQFNPIPQALTNPFGLYVHIPFCVHKCSYCDFYSFTQYASSDFEVYARAVCAEINLVYRWMGESGKAIKPCTSLFFGGGTPSLFPVPLIGQILSTIEKTFGIAPGAEVTVEMNPETVTPEVARGFGALGKINRVSLGAQSFQKHFLKVLERLCPPEAIKMAVGRLREAGFQDLNLDLIFAIPGQSMADLLSDIKSATDLAPTHLSWYNLTLKPGHTLYEKLPTDDFCADLYEGGLDSLKALGFEQYEISNFSRPGAQCRHNLLYWDGGDFLGVGTSAASRFFWDATFHHRKQFSDYKKYFAAVAKEEVIFEKTNASQTVLEACFLEMRKNSGVNLSRFQERYGYNLTGSKNFGLYHREGLVAQNADSLFLTAKGRLLADRVTSDLVDLA